MKYNIDNIQPDSELLFFWGHRPSKDGTIIKSCCSQWWVAPFEEDGVTYHTAEQYMMGGKAALFNDEEVRTKILATKDPKACKKLGRQVRGFEASVWDAHKYAIVRQANLLKFGQNPELRTWLLSTASQVIVEASPYDKVWGIGLTQDDPKAKDPQQWDGENLLGFALMEVREELAQNPNPNI